MIERSCSGCHQPGGIAPFALNTLEQVTKMGPAVRAAVEARRMPPFLAAPDCAEYLDDPSLSDEEIATVGKWFDAGAPEGAAATAVNRLEESGGLSRVDLQLQMPVDYVPHGTDDYRCFVIDWPYETTRYVTGFRARPGNASTVHHVIGFLIPPDRVGTYQELLGDSGFRLLT